MNRKYTNAEKLAYYKAKAAGRGGASNYRVSKSRGGYGIPRSYVSGSGDYFVSAKRNYRKPYRYPGLGRKAGSAAGSLIGNSLAPGIGGTIGGALGGAIGQGAHSILKTVTGFGDYNVSKNSLVYNEDAVPQFTNNARCTMVTHREFITDVRGSTNFNLETFLINPANPITFPWLSSIADNYEEYVIQGLIFEFKTTSAMSIASTNTALGTVVLATQYNTLSETFSNKQQMENYEFAQSTVACGSVMHPIECDPSLTANQGLFYMNNPNAVAGDPRLYNIGKFSIATVGMQAVSTIGELWVTYKICLLKPRLTGNVSFSDHWVLSAISVAPGTPFGTLPVLSNSSTSYPAFQIGGTNNQAVTSMFVDYWGSGAPGNTLCYFNPSFSGNILVIYQLHGGAIVNEVDPTLTIYGNAFEITTPALGEGFVTYAKSYGAVNSDLLFAFAIQINGGFNALGSSPAFALAGGVFGAAFGNCTIYAIPANLVN